MRIHPWGLAVFAVFVVALVFARRPETAMLAALGTMLIEFLFLLGITGAGVDRSDRARR